MCASVAKGLAVSGIQDRRERAMSEGYLRVMIRAHRRRKTFRIVVRLTAKVTVRSPVLAKEQSHASRDPCPVPVSPLRPKLQPSETAD
jgi:hypothetical protein